MPDLRALLGDKYDDVMEAADEALTEAVIATGGQMQVDVLTTGILAAVLPDLLADAWDEGAADVSACHGCAAGPNPYRTERTTDA